MWNHENQKEIDREKNNWMQILWRSEREGLSEFGYAAKIYCANIK